MISLLDRQVVFFGGKGGVGKTTCSSAFALAASRRGRRVLLVSTDPAHSTSDIFETPFGAEEREIYPGLHGLEIDASLEARRYYVMGQVCVAKAFRGKGVFDLLYQAHRRHLDAQYDCSITEVATRNTRSMRAHDRIGFAVIDRYRDATDDWALLRWQWR